MADGHRNFSHSKLLEEHEGAEAASAGALALCSSGNPMYQSGTSRGEPLWHGPTIRPAFAAQVLGQLMMEARHCGSELRSYRNVMTRVSHPRFDVRI